MYSVGIGTKFSQTLILCFSDLSKISWENLAGNLCQSLTKRDASGKPVSCFVLILQCMYIIYTDYDFYGTVTAERHNLQILNGCFCRKGTSP